MAKDRNQAIFLASRERHGRRFLKSLDQGSLVSPADKRSVIFAVVEAQLDNDEKRPFQLGQKLNDTPYRYTRDGLWASLNAISKALGETSPRIEFGTEDSFKGSGSFTDFVNARLTGTVSGLISKIVENSRWG